MEIKYSKYHVEINPSEIGNQDYVIISKLVKDIAVNQ